MKNMIWNVCLIVCIVCSANAQTENTLKYTEASHYGTVDPITASNAVSIRIVELLFGSLYTFDIDRNIVPEFAEGMAELSGDYRSAVVTLKSGLKWSTGSIITADDIIFSYRAYISEKSDGTNGEVLKRVIKDIKKLSQFKIQVFFKKGTLKPEKYLTFFIVPEKSFKYPYVKKFLSYCRKPHPISGHYVIEQKDDEAHKIIYKSNHHYSIAQPNISKIELYTFENTQSWVQLLTAGSIDMLTSILPTQYPVLNASRNVRLQPYDSNAFPVLILNFNNPLLKTLEIRRALDMAINRQEIINSFYNQQGDPMSGPYTMNSPYNNPEVQVSEYRADKAEELLGGLGYEKIDGFYQKGNQKLEFNFVVYTSNDPNLLSVYLNLKQAWENIGIKINLQRNLPNSYYHKLNKKQFDITYFKRQFDVASEIFPLYSQQFSKPGGSNFGSYYNPKVQSYLDKSIEISDFPTKVEINKDIHKMLHDDVANIFLWQIRDFAAYSSKLKHVTIDPFFYFTTVAEWEFSKSSSVDTEWDW